MAYAVDWEIASAPDIEVVRTDPEAEVQGLGALGGLCLTPAGAFVVSEPAAGRVRWGEPGRLAVLVDALPGLVDGPTGCAKA